jgi:hypothetical protein
LFDKTSSLYGPKLLSITVEPITWWGWAKNGIIVTECYTECLSSEAVPNMDFEPRCWFGGMDDDGKRKEDLTAAVTGDLAMTESALSSMQEEMLCGGGWGSQ